MVAKLTVILFAFVCLMLGILLILTPWVDVGFGKWNENYLLALIVDKTGVSAIRDVVSSNWFRGAVTGFGVLNLVISFWEIANFKESVKLLEENADQPKSQKPQTQEKQSV